MIHHWNNLNLVITDVDYHHDWIPSVEKMPSQTSNPETFRDYKSFR